MVWRGEIERSGGGGCGVCLRVVRSWASGFWCAGAQCIWFICRNSSVMIASDACRSALAIISARVFRIQCSFSRLVNILAIRFFFSVPARFTSAQMRSVQFSKNAMTSLDGSKFPLIRHPYTSSRNIRSGKVPRFSSSIGTVAACPRCRQFFAPRLT